MLIPAVEVREFEKFGFIRCKGIPRNEQCYYLCVARGGKFIFVTPKYFGIQDWDTRDSRIHEKPNCRYRDNRKTCKSCRWHIGNSPLARIGICFCSKSDERGNYVDGNLMTCQEWEGR